MRGQRLAGAAAVVMFALAIVGMEPWSDRVLSAHMVQHLLLMVVVAPLAVVAWPVRRAPAWARGSAFAASVVAIQTIALLVWHLPGPYDAAEAHAPLHVLEHASLLLTAAAAWWVILTWREASIGVRFATCVGSAAPMMLLGVLMTFARAPWYPSYANAHGSLSPLADQQTAGALMWGPAGIAYVIAAAWLVASVVRDDERRRFAGATRG
ncbi:MAG TPA: cytochrome c oxidase assembly protein [Acidimicrobiia bacterium]|nr:cytochrome c oxidase assembly protein [Acidimicrobiia bacterium]